MVAESPQKGRQYERESYTNDEIRALLKRTASNAPSAVRNYALICVLWQGGLRIAEALDLRVSDFSLAESEIHVRHGKNDKPRFVQCGPDAVSATARWIAVRDTLELPSNAPLFCTLKGDRLNGSYVRKTLNRLARGAGWTKRIHPHGFRHTFAVNLTRNGVPPAFLMRQLGHASLDVTTSYLASISTADIAESMKQVSWQ